MAITQVSKIQVRTGLLTDLPQLDVGEIGFAVDTRQVFIGNDTSIIPDPISGPNNTEIVTSVNLKPNVLLLTNSTDLGTAADTINTVGKVQGLMVFNTDNNLIYVSGGSTTTSPWYPADGSFPITPA